MLFKSLEFKNAVGQKVKVVEIPVLEEDNPYNFMIHVRLQTFLTSIYGENQPKKVFSFKDYLKRVLKWPVYQAVFKAGELKHNA